MPLGDAESSMRKLVYLNLPLWELVSVSKCHETTCTKKIIGTRGLSEKHIYIKKSCIKRKPTRTLIFPQLPEEKANAVKLTWKWQVDY